MRIAPLADVKARLSAYVDECGVEGPIVITRNGKAVAVLLVPNDDDDLERLLLGAFSALSSDAQPFPAEHQGREGLSEEDFWKAVRKRRKNERPRPRQTAPPNVERQPPKGKATEEARPYAWPHRTFPAGRTWPARSCT